MRRRHRSRALGQSPQLTARPAFWFVLGGAVILFVAFRRRQVAAAVTTGVEKAAEVVSDVAFDIALPAAGRQYAEDIQTVADESGVSPFLIAALMEQESNYGLALSPPGPTGTGDKGHGHGLMQIDDRSHQKFLARKAPDGTPLWQIPLENIRYGVKVLKDTLRYFRNQPKTGAKVTVKAGSYANKMGVPAGTYPDPRPLTGDALLFAAIAGYNTGMGNALQAVAAGLPADQTTSKRKLRDGSTVSYASSILLRIANLTSRTA
jgi:hypothetical protein